MKIIALLIIGWILTLFHIDEFVITAFSEVFNKEVTIATYYFVFLVFGLIFEFISFLRGY